MFKTERIGPVLVVCCALISGIYLILSPDRASAVGEQSAERKAIYDESGNGRALVDAALKKAQADGKNVLIQFGGNWCGWCHLLQGLFDSNQEIAAVLRESYVLVHLDTRSNPEVVKAYVTDMQGVPYLTVLSPDNKVLVNQETGSLEIGPKHDPAKVLAFLNQWKPAKADAQARLEAALAQAKKDDKKVLLHLGSPSCGWCRKLEAFLAKPDVEALVSKDYIPLKIDLATMDNAQAVAAKYRKVEGGIPWMAILDADGKTIVTSDGPQGNTGYPVAPEEVAYFKTMIEKTARHMTSADQDALLKIVTADAAEILAKRG
ncbi:MAG: hypothetical protein AMXMBFR84_28590 [Candidatus Hydrogenedentota bacterium]